MSAASRYDGDLLAEDFKVNTSKFSAMRYFPAGFVEVLGDALFRAAQIQEDVRAEIRRRNDVVHPIAVHVSHDEVRPDA